MKYHIFASGSKGNVIYIESENAKILLDCGLSCRKIEQYLKGVGVLPGELDGIFVTHEHGDHTGGLKIANKYNIPVYATIGTWEVIGSEVQDHLQHELNYNDLSLKDLLINTFPVLHDAREPIGFGIDDGKDKVGYATDFGKFTPEMKKGLWGSTIYIFESNHDEDMVHVSPYPDSLKARILGDYGHISNEDAGKALLDLIQGEGEKVYLAHLSDKTNLPTLAEMVVRSILKEAGLQIGKDVHVQLAINKGVHSD